VPKVNKKTQNSKIKTKTVTPFVYHTHTTTTSNLLKSKGEKHMSKSIANVSEKRSIVGLSLRERVEQMSALSCCVTDGIAYGPAKSPCDVSSALNLLTKMWRGVALKS